MLSWCVRISRVSTSSDRGVAAETVCVRFWASARAAAGTAVMEVRVPTPGSLSDVVEEVVAEAARRGTPGERLREVLGVCSVLVGDRPHGARDRASVAVAPGQTVEFLPPFAGG
jgi:molybdopterin synthase sulfur carrier subunit